jgi:quercetin dioxygenase-like cupin family protein
MEKVKNLLDGSMSQYGDTAVPKIPVFVGNDMTSEVYFFKPNQILKMHRHPSGEQIFFILKGEGKMLVGENGFDIHPGSSIFVPAGDWHEIINGTVSEMVAVQVTKVGAGFEAHNG